MTYQIDPSKARGKKASKDFTEQEKKEVIDYLEAHANDPNAFKYLMEKHNCSNTTLGIICIQNVLKESNRKF